MSMHFNILPEKKHSALCMMIIKVCYVHTCILILIQHYNLLSTTNTPSVHWRSVLCASCSQNKSYNRTWSVHDALYKHHNPDSRLLLVMPLILWRGNSNVYKSILWSPISITRCQFQWFKITWPHIYGLKSGHGQDRCQLSEPACF